MADSLHGDKWARSVLLTVWRNVFPTDPTPGALQLAQAVGRFEGHYGYPSGDPAWSGSHNWGAIQEPHPTADNSFEHKDHRADGTEYVGHFAKYPSPEAGAKALLRELYRRAPVRSVIDSGNAMAMANAMRQTGYFEAPAAGYARNLYRHASELARAIGEPLAVTLDGASSSSTVRVPIGAGAMAALPAILAVLLLSNERDRR